MLRTTPRIPAAGVRRKWSNKQYIESLQESSPEVSSSDTFSSSFQADSGASAREDADLQLWDLDLHRGLRTESESDHYRAITTSATELINSNRPASPYSASIQDKCN